MDIYLIRHTTPDVPPGTCYGQSDVDVAASFMDEFSALHPKLKHLPEPMCPRRHTCLWRRSTPSRNS